MTRVPRQLSGAPRVSLTTDEVGILKVVDGKRSAAAIATTVGLDRLELDEALERLAMLGIIDLGTSSDVPAAEAAAGGAEDGIELPAAARTHIDRLHHILGQTDHYELLGLSRDADKSAIKAAYYRAGPGFHPDKLFRRELGPYKQKIEQIFAALTKAYDSLRYGKRRAAYDAALPPPRVGAQQRRQLIAAAIAYMAPAERSSSTNSAPAGGTPRPRPSAHPSAPGPARSSSAPGSLRPAAPSSSPVPHPSGVPEVRVSHRPPVGPRTEPPRRRQLTVEQLQAQRELLARKLKSRGVLPSIPPVPKAHRVVPKVSQRAVGQEPSEAVAGRSAAEVLRDRYRAAGDAVRQRRLDRWLEQGRVAMVAGDYRAATAAYEQARRLSPDDEQIAEQAREAAKMARTL